MPWLRKHRIVEQEEEEDNVDEVMVSPLHMNFFKKELNWIYNTCVLQI